MILVQHILEDARQRLAVLSQEAPVCEAADILRDANTPLVVVSNSEGVAVGVISKTDIVKAFSHARGDAHNLTAGAIMTTAVFSCRVDETLQSIWSTVGERRLRCTPVLDELGKPLGVVHARDIARALLNEITYEEGLLRDYVLGIGYQ
jgi:CBS domain-containing protein